MREDPPIAAPPAPSGSTEAHVAAGIPQEFAPSTTRPDPLHEPTPIPSPAAPSTPQAPPATPIAPTKADTPGNIVIAPYLPVSVEDASFGDVKALFR